MDFALTREKIFAAKILEDEELLNRLDKIVDKMCADDKTMNELVANLVEIEEEIGVISNLLSSILELCLNRRSSVHGILKKVLLGATPASDSKDVLL